MAEIFKTTLAPGKLELIGSWLPTQPWYVGGPAPQLSPAGGFRLDDPAGDVGIELIFATDESGPEPVIYQVPLTYRGKALEGADAGLIGTTEHGVLGTRWVYDAAHDPVAIAALLDLVQGDAEPQMQRESNAGDPSVVRRSSRPGSLTMTGSTVLNSADGTLVEVDTAADKASPAGAVVITLIRVLGRPQLEESFFADVVAPWQGPDKTASRGAVVVVS